MPFGNEYGDLITDALLNEITEDFDKQTDRRSFIKKTARWAGTAILLGSLGGIISCGKKEKPAEVLPTRSAKKPSARSESGNPDLSIARDENPSRATVKAIDAIGGMRRFVNPGNTVLIKPNASFMKPVDSATSTNPFVLKEIIRMCKECDASRVIIIDHTLQGDAKACLRVNGIGEIAKNAGAEIIAYGCEDTGHGITARIQGGYILNAVNIYPEVLQADVVISVPKAKHHSSTGVTLGMKNFIGVTTHMSELHALDIHKAIADLNLLIKPDLCVIDASTILLDNGPGGPGPIRRENAIIASHDIVAADSFACQFFGAEPKDIDYILLADKAGIGTMDYGKLKIKET